MNEERFLQAPIRAVVTDMWDEAANVRGLELRSADGAALPLFTAGAHIDVVTPSGVTRQYSLCNAPSEQGRYEICVLRAPDSRGGSESLHARVRPGTVLLIGPPRNYFPLRVGTHKSILIAGGIGITPILSMAEQLHEDGALFEIHYAIKSAEQAAFKARLHQRRFEGSAFLYASSLEAGRLELEKLFVANKSSAHFYVCGPARLIDGALSTAKATGVALDRVHYEYFASPAKPSAVAGSFEIYLAKSVCSVVVGGGETVVQALMRVGVQVATSCEQGVCGTCLTPVIDGVVDHLDYYLSDDERRSGKVMIPCCSRSKTPRLVLDV